MGMLEAELTPSSPSAPASNGPRAELFRQVNEPSGSSFSVPADERAHGSLAQGIVRLARPHQWIKNILVFVAPAAAGVLTQWTVLWHAAAAFGIFCLAASGTYFLNDAFDAQADRLHPKKRVRPVACGIVPIWLAISGGAVLLVLATGLGALLAGRDSGNRDGRIRSGQHRLFTGIEERGHPRPGAGKCRVCSPGHRGRCRHRSRAFQLVHHRCLIWIASRRDRQAIGEKGLLDGAAIDHVLVRQTLRLYSDNFLRSVRILSAGVTVTAYCLWAFERASQPQSGGHPIWFQLSIVPFVIALLHVLRLLDAGEGAAPEDLALHDRRLQVYGVCWIVLFAVATYS